jgi:hypothetical protein
MSSTSAAGQGGERRSAVAIRVYRGSAERTSKIYHSHHFALLHSPPTTHVHARTPQDPPSPLPGGTLRGTLIQSMGLTKLEPPKSRLPLLPLPLPEAVSSELTDTSLPEATLLLSPVTVVITAAGTPSESISTCRCRVTLQRADLARQRAV